MDHFFRSSVYWDHHRASFPEKIQSTETYAAYEMQLRSGVFSAKCAQWWSRGSSMTEHTCRYQLDTLYYMHHHLAQNVVQRNQTLIDWFLLSLFLNFCNLIKFCFRFGLASIAIGTGTPWYLTLTVLNGSRLPQGKNFTCSVFTISTHFPRSVPWVLMK